MNEVDYLRQQLSTERAHLREILEAVRQDTRSSSPAHPVTRYVDWASRRLLALLNAHGSALQNTAAAALSGPLGQVAAAAARTDAPAAATLSSRAERLLAVLDAWTDDLDRAAASTLRIAHWRQAAALTADTILEERQLHAAARGALGLS